ncbi:AAA family ATPase [Melittangium boletus]|uniref:AAA family ATPase n=1 Tax=Melittangium boletus TaxID=83453 RepID=UPI003DA49545
MLGKIRFKFGAGPGLPRLRYKPGAVTVFVGPNNAGKSRALSEIAADLGVTARDWRSIESVFQPQPDSNRFILHDISVSLPGDAQLRAEFIRAVATDFVVDSGFKHNLLMSAQNSDENNLADNIYLFGSILTDELTSKGKINILKLGIPRHGTLQEEAERYKTEVQRITPIFRDLFDHIRSRRYRKIARRWILRKYINLGAYRKVLFPHTIILNGATRLALVKDTKAIDWRNRDGNLLANLLKNHKHLEKLRHIVHSALGYYPVIDTTHPKTTKLKFSKDHPQQRERSTSSEVIDYFDKARPIDAFSDGVKSFVGILSAVLSENHKIILIDEPEAFLHPPLARRLGVELHTLARENNAQVFAATHSPDFLMGCIQSGTDVNIVRLTFRDQQATARELKPEQVRDIMRHPLLRSTGVLGALFHDGAVVCESDSDRAFYQELNERLLAEGRGAQGVAFLNAQNKQTIERIIKPLRQMGIPAAAVLDIDVLSTGEDLSRLLMAAGTDPAIQASLTSARDKFFKRCMEHCGGTQDDAKKQLKQKGLQLLPERERAEFRSILFRPLEERGIFVVPEGELESWLPDVSHDMGRSEKSKWLVKMFERLGDDPAHPEYVKPGQQGVWSFLDSIAKWIAQPVLGIPDNA